VPLVHQQALTSSLRGRWDGLTFCVARGVFWPGGWRLRKKSGMNSAQSGLAGVEHGSRRRVPCRVVLLGTMQATIPWGCLGSLIKPHCYAAGPGERDREARLITTMFSVKEGPPVVSAYDGLPAGRASFRPKVRPPRGAADGRAQRDRLAMTIYRARSTRSGRGSAGFGGGPCVPGLLSELLSTDSRTSEAAGQVLALRLRCSWAGTGSNRRPSTFQADARTN
jgi:hypothetical protein